MSKTRLFGLAGLAAAACLALASAAPASAAVSADPAATPVFNGSVYAVAFGGSTVYVGGDFTAAIVRGKQIPRQRLAAVDARTGALLDWAPAADNVVRAIAASGDAVWIGGDFQAVNGQSRDSLAKVSTAGVLDPVKHRITGGTPRTLAVGGNRLYMAGLFDGVDGAARGNTAAFALDSGALDTAWAPKTDDLVTSLAVTANRVYLGGSFHRTNNISSTGRLIAVHPGTGAVDTSFRPQPPAIVTSLALSGGRVYAGLGGQGGRVIAYSADTAKAVWTVTTDGDVQALAALGDAVYIGGHYDNVCQTNRNGAHGICTDGSVDRVKLSAVSTDGDLLPWNPTANGVRGVLALAASPTLGAVAAGGEFTTMDGASQKRFALFG